MSTEIVIDDFGWIKETGPDANLIKLLNKLVLIKEQLPRDYKHSKYKKIEIISEIILELSRFCGKFKSDSIPYIVINKLKTNLIVLHDIVSGKTVYTGDWLNPYSKKQVKRIKQTIEEGIQSIVDDKINPFSSIFNTTNNDKFYSWSNQ